MTTTQPISPPADLAQAVDALFAAWDRWDSPGAAVGVWRQGKLVYKRGYGCANLEYQIPITPTTVFHVASVSKQFTTAAIVYLAQQGQLALDDDIRRYLPFVPDFGPTITIRHLANHTSGLRDQWQLLAMAGWRLDDVITKEQIHKLVRRQQALNFAPGAKYMYCNTGYTLLADLVEAVTGQSLRDFAHEHFFKPLGMVHTHFHDDHELIVPNRAYSYAPTAQGGFKKSVLNYATVGATSLFTTVEDLARWVQHFAEGERAGAAWLDQMQQRGVLNDGKVIDYALGLSIGDYRGLKTVGHSGGDAGFRSHLIRFPEQQFAVIVLSNLATLRPRDLCLQIADLYLADQLAPAATVAAATETPTLDVALLASYTGVYLDDEGELITITAKADYLSAALTWDPDLALTPLGPDQFSAPKQQGRVTFERDQSGQITQVNCQFYGVTWSAQRIEPWTPTATELAVYSGEYTSPELGTSYTLVVQDQQLVIQHQRHSDIALTPVRVGQFTGNTWWTTQLVFQQATDGPITGFTLSGGRVKGLQFVKQAPCLSSTDKDEKGW